MRTNVTFSSAEEFVPLADNDCILSIKNAAWFVAKLRNMPALQLGEELCQEDWGVVIFARRHKARFWIGLSFYPAEEFGWIAHVHHAFWPPLQRFMPSGKRAMDTLVSDLHTVLKADASISRLRWRYAEDVLKARDVWSDSP